MQGALVAGNRALARYLRLGGLLLLEGVLLGIRFDADSITQLGGAQWNALLSRVNVVPQLLIAIATAAALLGGRRLLGELRRASADGNRARRTWPFLTGHFASLIVFTILTRAIFEGPAGESLPIVAAWAIVGLAVPAFLLAAALPLSAALVLVRATNRLLVLAVSVGAAAWTAGYLTETLWRPLRAGTLASVHGLLSLLVADPLVKPGEFIVGSERFWVTIAPACSGYQGIGMIWVFLGVYLWTFRDSLRFPRALLLIPVATLTVWLANVARITGLVLLGTWGSSKIALGGFHSYVGSLLFSTIALLLASGCHRLSFFRRSNPDPRMGSEDNKLEICSDLRSPQEDNPTAAYLLPMLAIFAATMVAGAVSVGGFDLLYPLRLPAVVVCLWFFRGAYRELRWTWSWQAVGAGIAVFAIWLALVPVTAQAQASELPAALSALPAAMALGWLGFRVLGAVLMVPLAEELAFRGYLSRRITSGDFQSIPLRQISWVGLLVSSLLFGAMHNQLMAGTIAGFVYGLVARRRGELSDAIVAHATTNALLAVYVITTGSWALWG